MVDFEQIYNECQCAGAAAGANSISSFTPENNKGVVDIHEKNLEESTSKNNIRFREGVLEYTPELEPNGVKMNFKKIYQKSLNESMEDDNWDEPYEGDEMDDISNLDFNVLDGEWDVHQDYEDSIASDMKPIGTPHNDEQVDYDGVYGYQDPNPEDWMGFESEHMIPTKPLGHGRYQFESPTLAGVGEGRDYTDGYAEIVDYDPFEESFNQSYSSSKSTRKVKESKMKESFDFEDDDDLGYDDFDYEGEMTDTIDEPEWWRKSSFQSIMDNESDENAIADTFPTTTPDGTPSYDKTILDQFEKSGGDWTGRGYYVDDNDESYVFDNDRTWEFADKMPESKKVMPRSIRESRALIGGSLESKERTDYENTLEEHNKKRKYDKVVDSIDQKLTGVDSGAHGKHEWTGELKK